MKKRFQEIIKKYNCKLEAYQNENNFYYRYVTMAIDDENGQHLNGFDYEYRIDDDKEEIFSYFENWLKEHLS